MTTLAGWMIENTAVVAIAIPFMLLLTLCRKNRPAEHNLYWLLLLVKLVLPPIYVWPMSGSELRDRVVNSWNAAHAVDPVAESRAAHPPVAESVVEIPLVRPTIAARESIDDQRHVVAVLPAGDSIAVADVDATAPAATPQIARETSIANASSLDLAALQEWLAAAWLLGTAIVAWRLARHVLMQRQAIANGAPAPVEFADVVRRLSREIGVTPIEIRISQHVESPSIACLGRPILIWPSRKAALAPGHDFEGVILHELAHIRRKDHWVAWLELGATLVAWWNPVFWFVRRQIHESRELACDAAVMHLLPDSRREYAELLLYFCAKTPPVQWAMGPVQTGFMSRHSLKRRLKMIFNDRVSSRTSTLGFALTALIAVMSFPGWAWSQSREEKPQAADESSAAAPASADPEVAAQELRAQPAATDQAPASEPATVERRPETTSGPGNQRVAPARAEVRDVGGQPPEAQNKRGRAGGPPGSLGRSAPEQNPLGRNVPATAAPDGDNVVQEIPVPDTQQKVRISTSPQGIVTVEFDFGDGRLHPIGTFSSRGVATTQWTMGNPTRRIDAKAPLEANRDGARENYPLGALPKPGQPGGRAGANRPADAAPGRGPINILSNGGQRDPASAPGMPTPSEHHPALAAGGASGQPELVELAQINVEEKSIELDAARDEANANPGNAKLQRKLKLATLALRRAEIEYGLAKSRQPADGNPNLLRRY